MADVVLHALTYVLLCFGTLVGSHLLPDSQKSIQVTQISAFCFQYSSRFIHPSDTFIDISIGSWE